MTVDKFLHFLISHNATIIEVLIALTLLVVVFLSIRIFMSAKEPIGTSSQIDMSQLEGTLKEILERAGQVPAPVASGGSGSTGAGAEESQRLLTEISNLKTELETRQSQIESLKSATAPAASSDVGISEEDKGKLEAQIQELQAKLSEYEIISEDIADLSFYKEQNVKLQKELDALKVGGAVAPAGATASASVAEPEPVEAPAPAAPDPSPAEEPEIVGKSKVEEEAPAADPFAEAAAASAPAPEVSDAEKNVVDDDLMAEFAAAVEKQKAAGGADEAPAAPASEAAVDLGQMDMDKMLAEAADIKTDVPEVDPEKALGTGLDENKLLQEAAALEGVTTEDKKLMGDFENFVKKSES